MRTGDAHGLPRDRDQETCHSTLATLFGILSDSVRVHNAAVTYQLSGSEIWTPKSVVMPFVFSLAGSTMACSRSETLAVWPVTEVKASLTVPMADDIMAGNGREVE